MDTRTAKYDAYRIAAELIRKALDSGYWSAWLSDDQTDSDIDRIEVGLMEIEDSLRLRSTQRKRKGAAE